ncbi:MAG: 16S rRNA (guanine(966)-N(2))-methyltransferase RsmD [Clostridia bacterium]|nr:16S rRNA (guanine(966)-N(2))-methyltransferase RsmD [Clostridia bacterium]
MMRIITGKARGIRLKTLEGEATRPTSERVKEAVFSMLQFDIEGREVLDLFAGSGQMGLEALSRGAAHSVFVDRAPDAINIIRENSLKTKLAFDCSIYRSDALDYIRRNRGKKFDLIFLDPPYASDLYRQALRALCESDMLKPSTLIICESNTQTIFGNDATLEEYFAVQKVSQYSKTVITVLSVLEKESS